MKPYEQYKASGVAWLGEVPKHWEMCRLKNTCDIYNGATPSSANSDYWDGEIIWITPKDINDKKFITTSERKITEEGLKNCGTRIVPKNSVILTTRAPIGKVAIAAQELCTNQGCKSLVINEKINSHFLYYLLSSSNERLNTLGTGTTFMELGATALGNIKIALPPLEEQTTIATFLDERTAYIDQLIAKQQALSEKLSEKRTALITEAVCGRLNTNAEKLRDSGVQWLGKMPEHWEVKKFKYLCKIITGYTPSKNDSENYDENGFLWVKPDNLNDFSLISNTKEKISIQGLKPNYLIPKGSILVCSIGTIGKIGIAEKDVVTNQQINSFIFNELVSQKFSKYLMYSVKNIFEYMANDNVVRILNSNTQKNISAPLPPLEEQTAIADYLDKETAKIDRLQEKIAESVARLKEYRSALITQAVTGKIKV